jgi:energy-coupling factor transporter ATP-binding protein EcfA2
MSTLLANKELREKYDNVHLKFDEKKELLVKELKPLSGLRSGIEDEISVVFTSTKGKLFTSLERIEKEVLDKTEPEFSDVTYKSIFNDKVIMFLDTKDFKVKITEYIKKYDELIDSSAYFKKGIFNHNNAAIIAKNLADNGFFKAKHSVSLNTETDKKEITGQKELEEIIEKEKESILTNPDLVKAFDEIDAKLKANKELRDFRDYLLENIKILPELGNTESFKQKLWISYLKSAQDAYKSFFEVYQTGKKELEEIIEQAKKEKTNWMKVIGIFNKRFVVPFHLKVENQDDVILKSEVPSIEFIFKDNQDQVVVEKTELLKALSSGEKRALYILNIIFEFEARKEVNQKTLFVIDDIADSFDYKNKYAIIEYLKEIADKDNFYQIILTHNFDFFRTLVSRFVGRKQSCMIVKTDENIELIDVEYLKPFSYFKSNLHSNDYILIASIPFIRNLVEYTKNSQDDDFVRLTSLLHIKQDTNNYTVADLETIFNNVINNQVTLNNKTKRVIDLIFELGANLSQNTDVQVSLENKIVLSIGIRLKAELFMISQITDQASVAGITKNQTSQLFEFYRNEPNAEDENIKLLEQVNLMTPENIHFNSFMYEPILDMSDEHLRQLYVQLDKLLSESQKTNA